MSVVIKHKKHSNKPDGTDASVVQPTDWNEEHAVQMAGPALVGKSDLGNGDAEEIEIGDGLKLENGQLKVDPVKQYVTKAQADQDYADADLTEQALITLDNSIPGKVRSAILTGIDLSVNAAISAADSVIGAFGKLQKQISDHIVDGKGHLTNAQKANAAITGIAGADVNGNVYDAAGNLVSGGSGLPRRTLSITAKSSMPQAIGSFAVTLGQVNIPVMENFNKGDMMEVVFMYAGAPYEAMKGTTGDPALDGSGKSWGTVQIDGVAYPHKDINDNLSTGCAYGDIAVAYVKAPRDVKKGEVIRWKGGSRQVAATTGTNSGQFFCYFQRVRGDTSIPFSGDRFFRFLDNAITDAEIIAFSNDVTDTTTYKGANADYVGWRPFLIAAPHTGACYALGSDSRDHGSPITNTGSNDGGQDTNGIMGEAPRTLGRRYSLVNCGIQTESFYLCMTTNGGLANTYKARSKVLKYARDSCFGYGINEPANNPDFNTEITTKAAYKAMHDAWLGLFTIPPRRRGCKTIGPNTPTSDFMISTNNQTPSQNQKLILNAANGAIRRGEMSNNFYIETMNAVCTAPNNSILKVHPRARLLSTGNATIRTSGATATTPATTELLIDNNPFTRDDDGLSIVWVNKGTGPSNLQCQLQYVSTGVMRMVLDGSADFDYFQLPASRLASPLDPTNTGANVTQIASTALGAGNAGIYIGALHYGGDIHRNWRGEEEIANYNWSRGLVPID